MTHRTDIDHRAALPELFGGQGHLAARGDHILDDEHPAIGHRRALGELCRPVGLGFLADERRRDPGGQREGGGHRHAAELQAGQDLSAGGHERPAVLGDLPQQPWIGLEEVLVEVGGRLLARPEREVAGEPAHLADLPGERLMVHDKDLERTGIRTACLIKRVDRRTRHRRPSTTMVCVKCVLRE